MKKAVARGRALSLAAGISVLATLALPMLDSLGAQARPDLDWRTIESGPFRVHFTAELEELARRTMANAQEAYRQLAAELEPPRGIVDIVVADNADFTNGFATPFPSNRIVIYARPPVDELHLRNHADWNRTLVTHELVHIFHLDRARGIWRLAQRVFGRAAPLFPNTYAPNWLLEGVAVHYETRLAPGGRLGGTEFPAQLRALALGDAISPLDGVATPHPFYPGGNLPYLLGAFLVDRAVRQDAALGPGEAMRRLVERMSGRLNPWRHDASAREATGTSFTALYDTWRDSVQRAAGALQGIDSLTEVRTTAGWTAAFPRFAPGGLLYAADEARRMPGLYRVDELGRVRRLARRNSVEANAPLGDGAVVYAELDRTDPYSVLSDLYVGRARRRQRLTVGDRLAHPDVHPETGRIVAVRTLPGTTELVTLQVDDPYPRVLVLGSLDRTWSEPRFSRDGSRIAAARWDRGGQTSIVVLDTAGRELQRFAPRARESRTRLAVSAAPVWLPGDTLILFASDHEGTPMIYRGDVRSGAYDRLWASRTALRSPDVSADGTRLAAVELQPNGWSVVTRAMPVLRELPPERPARDGEPIETVASAPTDSISPARAYAPSETARPTWWLPAVGTSDFNDLLLGAMSGGRDVVGRHQWQATVMRDLSFPEFTASVGYSFSGLGNPVLSVAWEQDWAHQTVFTTAMEPVGTLSQRSDLVSLSAYFVRPRARLTTYAILAAESDWVSYRTYPWPLLSALGEDWLLGVDAYPRAVVSAGLSSMQRPGLSVSVEDGLALQGTFRRRFQEATGGVPVSEAILEGSVAKSLPLPGYARHVLAMRGAYGVADSETRNLFSVGGISGSSLEVLPGLFYGDVRRTFFVRGFDPARLRGNRAVAGSVEYRAPLTRVGRGYRLLPIFLQKLSVLAFADAGTAWCEGEGMNPLLCGTPGEPRRWLASAGGELAYDVALQYDVLYRFRLGVAVPTTAPVGVARSAQVYFTLGSTF